MARPTNALMMGSWQKSAWNGLLCLGSLGWLEMTNSLFGQTPENPPDLPVQKLSVPYRATDTVELYLDLYLPFGTAPKEGWPVILYIHGGGWSGGSKAQATEERQIPVLRQLLEEGVALVAIDYRKGEQAQNVGDPLTDCLYALRWIEQASIIASLDPERIGLWGTSAGGHLALMTAIEAERNRLTGIPQPLRVATWYPATELSWILEDAPRTTGRRVDGLGFNPKQEPKLNQQYSPLHQVRWLTIPTLLIHGREDSLIHSRHSDALHWELQKRSQASSLILVDSAEHGFRNTSETSNIFPDFDTIVFQTVSFLSQIKGR